MLFHLDGGSTKFDDERKALRMAGETDQVKGGAKEAVGSLTDDQDLKSEGKADRRAGEAKEKLGHATEKIDEIVDKGDEKVEEIIDKTKDALHRK